MVWRGVRVKYEVQLQRLEELVAANLNLHVKNSLTYVVLFPHSRTGAVGVFDAVKGVEAQTEVVWRQCDRYGGMSASHHTTPKLPRHLQLIPMTHPTRSYQVPRLAFINKMDR